MLQHCLQITLPARTYVQAPGLHELLSRNNTRILHMNCNKFQRAAQAFELQLPGSGEDHYCLKQS